MKEVTKEMIAALEGDLRLVESDLHKTQSQLVQLQSFCSPLALGFIKVKSHDIQRLQAKKVLLQSRLLGLKKRME